MKLIKNWKAVSARAHSMWAFYGSLFCLVLPELIYWAFSIDTSPRLWWGLGVLLLIYGILGRVLDQGIDRTKIQAPWFIVLALLAIVCTLAIHRGDYVALPDSAISEPLAAAPVIETAEFYDQAFLDIAIPFVGKWEGLRLEAYLDIVGTPTVCYGETKGVQLGDSYSNEECDAMLAREIIAYRDQLRPAFDGTTLANLMPVTRDVAFTSLAYNAGVSAISNSTAVRRLNAGEVAGACDAMGWWNKAGGRVIRGLVNRRTEEIALCLRGYA